MSLKMKKKVPSEKTGKVDLEGKGREGKRREKAHSAKHSHYWKCRSRGQR